MPMERAQRNWLIGALTTLAALYPAMQAVSWIGRVMMTAFDARYETRADHQQIVAEFHAYRHDDSLGNRFAQQERFDLQHAVDSIERAHRRGHVMQAGEPRPSELELKP